MIDVEKLTELAAAFDCRDKTSTARGDETDTTVAVKDHVKPSRKRVKWADGGAEDEVEGRDVHRNGGR